MKNLKDLAKKLCECEGKKRQVNIADMAETLKYLCILIAQNPITVIRILLQGAVNHGGK